MTTSEKKRFLLAQETIDRKDIAELISWLETDPWLTQGPLTKQFETEWSRWLGTEYALYVNSGSSANLMMYYALLVSGRLKNRKVIVPAISWATTVAPAIQLGFEPIMCDGDPHTFGLDLDHLERLCQEHDPGAVIVVHVLGVPHKMEELLALKGRYDFALMEDACAATGSRYDGKLVGTFGDLSTFSFYFGHHLSTIEGGMVCTSDEELQDILLQIRSHGWAKDLSPEKEQRLVEEFGVLDFNRRFAFYHPGFNLRPTDLGAKLGLGQLKKVEEVIARRKENHRIYQQNFEKADHFHCQSNDRAEICSISFAALASSEEHRARVARALEEFGVETRPLGGGNMSRQPFWTKRYEVAVVPMADRIHTTSFHLPNNPSISPEDIQSICDVVLAVR